MSESSTSDNVEIIAQYESLFVSLCCSYATFVYMCYDWMLTLDDEISLFWNRRVSAASILYFAIRYPVVIFWIMGYPTTHLQGVMSCFKSCEAYMYTVMVTQLLIYLFPAVFSALRVYALTAQNKFLAAIVLFFALGPIYANSAHFVWEKPIYVPDFGCVVWHTRLPFYAAADVITGISRGMLSVADLLVIIITWQKTSYSVQNLQGSVGPSLAKTLLRSGIIYFIPLALLNILHTILTETGAEQFLRNSSVVSLFIDPQAATSVLACRFLINLRKVEVGHNVTSTGPSASTTTMRFTPDVSNPTESTASGPASQGTKTLPPFISSMGELVDMGFSASTLHETGRWDTDCEDASATELAIVVDQAGVPAAERPASPRGREDWNEDIRRRYT
ncbi:hypothetical protein K466DRAFT_667728 [Polyporus arcularius HHB13444]|uniref:DUF6533 domain-containing protein n=1 Tax=Polyporus arcularius HHB13444 TaxID=1314778 RepID=A0A5C3NUS3_9APHY|nr:hypothetical protein K466DRAFT_667728 [Polyporus arcularius HHB13444]